MPKISVLTPSVRPEYLHYTQKTLQSQTFQDFEWLVEIGFTNKHTLSADLNKMLRRAKGERIVMLQDCILLGDTALEKIAELDPNIFYTFPIGKVMEFNKMPTWDWRRHHKGEITANQWEADLAVAPRRAFIDIGGYDETFDEGWSWDNVEVAWRAFYAGYKFECYPDIVGTALDHDKLSENPFRGKLKNNNVKADETMKKAERGQFKLNYL